ncbi:MAG: diphosphatase [Thermoleophilaceae bacterium]|nr:diphosphatase [Thermoleophilaceae bacterium]
MAMTEPNTFSGAPLDRAGERRGDAQWVAALLAEPASRAVVVTGDGVLVEQGAEPRLARVPLASVRSAPEPLLLGLEHGVATFAVDGTTLAPEQLDAVSGESAPVGLRDAGALLSHGEGGLVAQATGLVNWHRRHPHCAVCGALTQVAEAGYVRHCPSCGAQHHPRTDPVVIMLVTDGDRALLGRQARWPAGRYSTLAGFVEPGESLEEAVAREVLEEAGIQVRDPRYASSQPWPFPASLMLGFVAEYAGGEPATRDEELEHVRWFSREELLAIRAGNGNGLHVPPPIAIARRLIDGWLDRPAYSESE